MRLIMRLMGLTSGKLPAGKATGALAGGCRTGVMFFLKIILVIILLSEFARPQQQSKLQVHAERDTINREGEVSSAHIVHFRRRNPEEAPEPESLQVYGGLAPPPSPRRRPGAVQWELILVHFLVQADGAPSSVPLSLSIWANNGGREYSTINGSTGLAAQNLQSA